MKGCSGRYGCSQINQLMALSTGLANRCQILGEETQPNVRYVPVAADLPDLETKVRYVIDSANSEEMKQINTNSQAFRRTKLTIEQYTVDVLWTLLAYAELVKSSPDFNDV